MALRTIFFGNSRNVFSAKFYAALLETDCEIVGAVDIPTAVGASTNPHADSTRVNFMTDALQRGVTALAPERPNRPEVVQTIGALQPDLFLAVGYTKLLKADMLAVPRIVSANVHASLLPAYRGKHPVFWALRHGEKFSGLTLHAMDASLDTGDILYQKEVRTRSNDSVATLYERIIDKGLPLVDQLIRDAGLGALPRKPQNTDKGSYFSGTTEKDFHIQWSRPAEEIRRWIVTTPGQCFTQIAGKRIFFLDALAVPCPPHVTSGTLLAMGPSNCTIATGNGALEIGKFRDSKNRQTTAADLFRKEGLPIGEVIPPQ